MILHNGGKYNGDESILPQREHPPGAVVFKEAENMKRFAVIVNVGCILTMIALAVPFVLLVREHIRENGVWLALGGICGGLSLPVHELLHALCYKRDVYFFNNLKQGMVFVVGTEDMSKARFIFMCLCPNIFLGLIPYALFLIFPNIAFLGLFGLICTGMGFGDYVNVFNAAKQMPKGAKTYLCGHHSYWYREGA